MNSDQPRYPGERRDEKARQAELGRLGRPARARVKAARAQLPLHERRDRHRNRRALHDRVRQRIEGDLLARVEADADLEHR